MGNLCRAMGWALAALLWLVSPSCLADVGVPLRIGLTSSFLHDRHALIVQWKAYLERKLGRPVSFTLRDSYRDAMDLMRRRQLDAAWLCDCPYVTDGTAFRLLATPVFQGRPYYRAYLIVPRQETAVHGIVDLRGKVFAYTDPYSNVGYLIPRSEIKRSNADPDHFFRRSFYAWSHRNALEAVAAGIADGTSVSNYIWDTLRRQSSALTSQLRVASQSGEFGFPPFVAHRTLGDREFHALQMALVGMSRDEEGRALLKKMNLDGFIVPDPKFYRAGRDLARYMHGEQDAPF